MYLTTSLAVSTTINSPRCRRGFAAVLTLACFGLSPAVRAQLPSPSPDGGYPNQNTAEGEGALQNVSPFAERNTAVGFEALFGNVFGRFNTATGAFALSNNNGTFNTATGDSALKTTLPGLPTPPPVVSRS